MLEKRPLPLEAQQAIDALCDEFEARLRAGDVPRIEDALLKVDEAWRADLFRQLLKIEREVAQKAADADYLRRFPDYAAILQSVGCSPAKIETVPQMDSDKLPTIPGYQILSQIGIGGMGVVYKAHEVNLNRFVAVKMVRTDVHVTPTQRQRFRMEAEDNAALDHAHIIPVYRVDDVEGKDFLCLKYVENGSLADRLKTQNFTPTEAAMLMRAISRGVQHAHERGLLHRDLKPANILLDGDNCPYVADFGLARRITPSESLTGEGAIEGTFNYMAPEQARGKRDIAVTADVYALGAILYELLTKRPPVLAKTIQEVWTQHSEEESTVRPRVRHAAVPIDLDAICMKCLERDPADRYASAAELAADLDRFLNNEAVSAQPPGVWDWLVQAMRTRPHASPLYTWSAPVCLGIGTFVQHVAIFGLVVTSQPMWVLWAAYIGSLLGLGAITWFLLLRRFRLVPVTERHSIVICSGHLAAQLMLLLVFAPTLHGSSDQVLRMYPSLMILSGLCWVVLGSTHWGRFLPIGIMFMGLALVPVAWPMSGPPLYAVTKSAFLIWWGLAKLWYFVPREEAAQSSSNTLAAASNQETTDL